MMFGWFNAKKAEEFGTSLAQILIEKMPPGRMLEKSKLSSKTEYILVQLLAKIDEFKKIEKLNLYKKAKIANSFKWTLKDGGFEEAFNEKLVEWLVTHL